MQSVKPWLAVVTLFAACTPPGVDSDDPIVPDFTVRPGVEVATVIDVEPGDELTLYDDDGKALIAIVADELGQAHFAYVPDEFTVFDSREGILPIVDGGVLKPGEYVINNDATGETSGPFTVLAIDDVPADSFFESQTLTGIVYSVLDGHHGEPTDAFQYVETRDGTLISVMVRFPDPMLYGEGPYPTVIEYSGYSPSRPDRPDSGSQIANALGYATVGVNMRGTGCSGGVFDVFNRAQHADGYDVIEVVARQEWVLNNQVGMVGLSYPGISQVYVASTNPPSLAAAVPLSVIADAWQMQWPGGIYNSGFTKTWVAQREADAAMGGTSWVVARIDEGDTVCEENVRLSSQNIDFGSFLHGLEFRPRDADDRDLNLLVEQIAMPIFLGGAWQDEQTGALFGSMVDRFYMSPKAKFLLYNGRHPDGYGPDAAIRWHEFLEFYVAKRVPRLNFAIRTLGAAEFASSFGFDDYEFPDDRFEDYEDDEYAEALAAYEAESPVRVLFESGAGADQVGVPVARFEAEYDKWPTPEATEVSWYLDDQGLLAETVPDEGVDSWTFDADAGASTFFGPKGYLLLEPLWDIDWTEFDAGKLVSYVTDPFADDTVVAGPGLAELWIRSPDEDEVQVQVTLTEVRPDGIEVHIQSGWLDLGHRAATRGDDLRLHRTYAKEDYESFPVDEWVKIQVAIPSFAHPLRQGSSLRLMVSSPGRNHGTWEFEAPAYDGTPTFHLGRGGSHASTLILTTLPGIDVADGLPECPSLRGQPCRDYRPVDNVVVE